MQMSPDPSQNSKEKSHVDDIGNNEFIMYNQAGSSSEDDTETMEFNGYEQISQDSELVGESIDYSSLPSLISAADIYGVTEVDPMRDNLYSNNIPSQASFQSATDKVTLQIDLEYNKVQSALWNSPPSNTIIIDETKADEIKNVMSKITLPHSSVPCWAQDISDDDWKSHIDSVIYGKGKLEYANKRSN